MALQPFYDPLRQTGSQKIWGIRFFFCPTYDLCLGCVFCLIFRFWKNFLINSNILLSFSVTVSGYGADSFYLGDMEIPGDADLADYGEKLLELAGLSRVYYRVNRVEWDGEPYMDGEVMFRNATAGGSKLIRNVKAKYGGQIRTPDLKGKQYIGIYEEVLPETEDETGIEPEPEIMSQPETIPDTSEETVQASLEERIIEWLESHITTITVSFVSVLLLAAGIWLFVKSGKKPGRQSP